ncbi:MAG: ArsR family transcriptional regulator [Candidatus Heimdallarchaeota archaeon]|nr:ArsR family transcriptional regulator [Candidatus Heimdallarchaeota archaeon]
MEDEITQNCVYEKLSILLSGKNRKRVFLVLNGKIMTASEIAEAIGVKLPSICRTLKFLVEKNILECFISKHGNVKLYKIPSESTVLMQYLIQSSNGTQ